MPRPPGARGLILAFLALLGGATSALAQGDLELQGSTAGNHLAGFSYAFDSGFLFDGTYSMVPGWRELDLGAGYVLGDGRGFTLVPLLLGSYGLDAEERGIITALWGEARAGRVHVTFYGGRFLPTGGPVGSYTLVDPVQVTLVAGRWEWGGGVADYTDADGRVTQGGPLVKLNDALGGWEMAILVGSVTELRLTRSLRFGGPDRG